MTLPKGSLRGHGQEVNLTGHPSAEAAGSRSGWCVGETGGSGHDAGRHLCILLGSANWEQGKGPAASRVKFCGSGPGAAPSQRRRGREEGSWEGPLEEAPCPRPWRPWVLG